MVDASDTLTFAELAQVRPGPYLPEQSSGLTFQDLTNGLTVSNRSAYNVCKSFAMTYV